MFLVVELGSLDSGLILWATFPFAQMVGLSLQLIDSRHIQNPSFFKDSKSDIQLEKKFCAKILVRSCFEPGSVELTFFEGDALPSALASPGIRLD